MEICIQLIFIIALAKYCLKAALSGKLWILSVYAAAAAVLAMAICPIVITQPVTIISKMLGDKAVIENMAMITTVEAITGIFLSVYLLDNYFMPKSKRRKTAFVLKIIPGILSLCAIGYFELLFFKWRAGQDFAATAILFAATLFIAVAGFSSLIMFSVKSESLKLEIKLIFNLCILVLGLLVCSSVADYNISNAQTDIEWKALAAMIITMAALTVAGVWVQKINPGSKSVSYFMNKAIKPKGSKLTFKNIQTKN